MRITAAINCAPSFLLKLIRAACDRHKIKNSLLTLTCRALNLIYAPAASHLFSAAVVFLFFETETCTCTHYTHAQHKRICTRECSSKPSAMYKYTGCNPLCNYFAAHVERVLEKCYPLSLSQSGRVTPGEWRSTSI